MLSDICTVLDFTFKKYEFRKHILHKPHSAFKGGVSPPWAAGVTVTGRPSLRLSPARSRRGRERRVLEP